jgi:hypothetical protein
LLAFEVPSIEKVSQWQAASRAAIFEITFEILDADILEEMAKDKAAHPVITQLRTSNCRIDVRSIPRSCMTLFSPRASICRR